MNPQSPYTQGGQTPYQPQPAPQQPMQPQPGLQQQYVQPGTQQAQGMQPMQSMPQPGYSSAPANGTPPIAPRRHGSSPAKLWIILTIVFALFTIGGAIWAVYATLGFNEQKATVDSQVTSAVAEAVKKEQDAAAKHLLEVENTPTRVFTGPSDYGNLTFNYSKLWAIYIPSDAAKGGNYEALFNPLAVHAPAANAPYALRVNIVEQGYDQVVAQYEALVKKGDLVATNFKLDDTTNGTRFDGAFTKDIRGSAVVFKIRDKTVTIRTEADTFRASFDELIKTIKFEK